MVVEVRHSQDMLAGIEAGVQLFTDAICARCSTIREAIGDQGYFTRAVMK